MGNFEASDFPLTRNTIDRLDVWVMELASPLLPLKKTPLELEYITGFVYEFCEASERALLISKAVRMASGIRVAMLLADLGYISECGSILRTVTDFANEIICICDGIKTGQRTTAHQLFVEQYFMKLPKTPDEYDAQPRVRFVTRDELLGAQYRWAIANKLDATRLRKVTRFLANMYDKFVHGSYVTAMELYDPRSSTFMLRGHEAPEKKQEYKRATASKLHTSVTALAAIAEFGTNRRLLDEICRAAVALYASGELS
jgi:hypothetical protein